MASNNDPRSINATFSGTTVDTALLTNFWDSITIRNNDTTNTVYVRFDGTDPAAGQEGAFIIGPASSRTFGASSGIKNAAGIPGNTTAATACHFIKLIGNGGSYGVDGAAGTQGAQAQGSSLVSNTGTGSGSWTVTDGVASHGKVVFGVGAGIGLGAASMQLFANTADANPVESFNWLGGVGNILASGPGGGTAVTAAMLLKNISTSTTVTGTVDGTEADLFTDTLTAGLLDTNGDAVCVRYAGTVINTGGTTKRVRVYFGGTVIWDSAALTIAAGGFWSIDVQVTRIGATSVAVWAMGTVSGPATSVALPQLVLSVTGLTLANTQIIKVTGQSTGGTPAANDVRGTFKKLWTVPVGATVSD